MAETSQDFSKAGFARTFVFPALWIFLVPAIGLAFFLHARGHFDDNIRESLIQQTNADKTLTEVERAQSLEIIRNVPFSRMLRDAAFAETVDDGLKFDYAVFRWMIRIAALSIVGGIGVFLFGGVCVVLSLRSQRIQYLSLSAGWHVLRIFSALLVIGQGAILVALSYWVTGLWLEVYYVKLVVIAALVAVCAVGAMLIGIFKKPDSRFEIEGELISKESASGLWEDLRSICEAVGTEPPDQLIAGIDDSFFVTEHPITVSGQTYTGRTLFVSLSLLRQLSGAEADAVMAHEMAHFSGNDTTYSRRITPLLNRYGNYLEALYEGGITKPVYYFMLCFRVLFELSLSRLSRQRELRADRIASEVTSPRDVTAALLKIVAFSEFRFSIEQKLFGQQEAHSSVNIFEQVDSGFRPFASSFADNKENIGNLETAHPVDSHPPLSVRTSAVGIELEPRNTTEYLESESDAAWYYNIDGAEEIERKQWKAYEDNFQKIHEESLAYRLLPENDAERDHILKFFPGVTFEGKTVTAVIDYEKVEYSEWSSPVYWQEINNCDLDGKIMEIVTKSRGTHRIKVSKFGHQQEQVDLVNAFQQYYGRYLAAVDYHAHQQTDDDKGE